MPDRLTVANPEYMAPTKTEARYLAGGQLRVICTEFVLGTAFSSWTERRVGSRSGLSVS